MARVANPSAGTKREGGSFTAACPAVALSELLAELPPEPSPLLSFRVRVPGEIKAEEIKVGELRADWRATPAPAALQQLGNQWLDCARTALLIVPSAIVEAEPNVLVNPLHADFSRIRIAGPHRFEFDARLATRLAGKR